MGGELLVIHRNVVFKIFPVALNPFFAGGVKAGFDHACRSDNRAEQLYQTGPRQNHQSDEQKKQDHNFSSKRPQRRDDRNPEQTAEKSGAGAFCPFLVQLHQILPERMKGGGAADGKNKRGSAE